MNFIADIFFIFIRLKLKLKKREDPEDLMGIFKVTLRAFFATAKKENIIYAFVSPGH